jgi:hypothetical protein
LPICSFYNKKRPKLAVVIATEIASDFREKRKKKVLFFYEITVEKPKGCC